MMWGGVPQILVKEQYVRAPIKGVVAQYPILYTTQILPL